MKSKNETLEEVGNEVMKSVGALQEESDVLTDVADGAAEHVEEAGGWLKEIGRVILAILK